MALKILLGAPPKNSLRTDAACELRSPGTEARQKRCSSWRRRHHRGAIGGQSAGLGLAPVKKLAMDHGGEVGVRNDNGAVFVVRVPRP